MTNVLRIFKIYMRNKTILILQLLALYKKQFSFFSPDSINNYIFPRLLEQCMHFTYSLFLLCVRNVGMTNFLTTLLPPSMLL